MGAYIKKSHPSRPIRVAIMHYRDDADSGGSLRVGETIANNLDTSRVEPHLVFAYGNAGAVAGNARVKCHYLRAKGATDLAAWYFARAFFKRLAPDIIHFQDAVMWLRLLLLGGKHKTIVHLHGRLISSWMKRRDLMLMKAFSKLADANVSINAGARDSLLQLGMSTPNKSYVVYNSVDCNKFSAAQNKHKARALLNLPGDALLIGMVCRLVWQKKCYELLDILDRLPNRWHGVFCGDGPQREELERLCGNRGLTNRVHFLGTQSDVAPVYAALDAYAFLTCYEPFGLVLAESMAAGVPVFGLDGEGEYKEEEYPLITPETAMLVRRQNPSNWRAVESPEVLDKLAQRIAEYGVCPENYKGQVEQARNWVRARFDVSLQVEAMTRVYERVYRGDNANSSDLDELYKTSNSQNEETLQEPQFNY